MITLSEKEAARYRELNHIGNSMTNEQHEEYVELWMKMNEKPAVITPTPPSVQPKETVKDDDDKKKSYIRKETVIKMIRVIVAHLFKDQYGVGYVTLENEPARVVRIESSEFSRFVKAHVYATSNYVPPDETVKAVQDVLTVEADGSPRRNLHNRIARIDGVIYYDLNNDRNEMVVVSPYGWRVEPQMEPIFVRHGHMLPQITPIRGGKLQDFAPLLNLKPGDDAVYLPHIATGFVPDIPRMIKVHGGGQGGAKTSRAEKEASLIDPSSIQTQSSKDDRDEIALSLYKHYAPVLDNVSNIDDELSDMLCRAVSGEGFEKRKLYEDEDQITWGFKRYIQITTIQGVAGKPDLVDRSLSYDSPVIVDARRLTEREVNRRFNDLKPRLLGAIFDALSYAIRNYDGVAAELQGRLPRMADFTIWGEAIARGLGYAPMEFFDRLTEKLQTRSLDMILADPVGEYIYSRTHTLAIDNRVSAVFQEFEQWATKVANLSLNNRRLPKTAQHFSARIRALSGTFGTLGREVEIVHKEDAAWLHVTPTGGRKS